MRLTLTSQFFWKTLFSAPSHRPSCRLSLILPVHSASSGQFPLFNRLLTRVALLSVAPAPVGYMWQFSYLLRCHDIRRVPDVPIIHVICYSFDDISVSFARLGVLFLAVPLLSSLPTYPLEKLRGLRSISPFFSLLPARFWPFGCPIAGNIQETFSMFYALNNFPYCIWSSYFVISSVPLHIRFKFHCLL